jgi:hypothetical protein
MTPAPGACKCKGELAMMSSLQPPTCIFPPTGRFVDFIEARLQFIVNLSITSCSNVSRRECPAEDVGAAVVWLRTPTRYSRVAPACEVIEGRCSSVGAPTSAQLSASAFMAAHFLRFIRIGSNDEEIRWAGCDCDRSGARPR